ncbi:MAG: Tyrosine-protein kinase ptk [Bacteroidota bacterium]|jgi:capsular exopolysaccharide synthesis family protein
MKNTENPFKEERADIQGFFRRLLRLWPVFLLSVFVFLFASFVAIRYLRPRFKVGATLILRDEKNSSMGAENLLEGLELFAGKNNLDNEIGVLKSYSLTRQAVLNSNLEVSYFSKSFFKVTERFSEFPFKVLLNKQKIQATGVKYFVKNVSDSTFVIEFESDDYNFYNFISEKTIKSTSNEKLEGRIEGVYGRPIDIDGLSVTLMKRSFNESVISPSESLFFTINNLEELIEGYQKDIQIQPINPESSILSIQLERPCVDKEILYLNNLCKAFIDRGLTEKNEVAHNTIEFIEEQLNIVNDSLIKSENDLQVFRQNNEVTDLSIEFQRSKELESELINELAEEELQLSYVSFVKRNISGNAVDWTNFENLGIEDQTLNLLLIELRKYQQEIASLQGSVSSLHPVLQTAEQQANNIKKAILGHVNGLEKSAIMNKSAIQTRINEVTGSYGVMPEKQRLLIDFERRFDLNNVMYTYLIQKKSEAQIARSSNTADTKFLDEARLLDRTATFPKPILFYSAALFLGLFIPIIFIIISDLLNTRISDKKELQNLSIPLIGMIGHNNTSSQIPSFDFPRSNISESFRLLKINLQYLFPGKAKRVIGLTSTVSGEGKTFVSINLALSLALNGSKTLLLATDMRRPKIHSYFNLSNSKGLSNFLVNQVSLDDIIQKSCVENLDIILSGPIPPNPFELLSLDSMNGIIDQLKNIYDHIIIDSAPVGLVADYFAVSDKVDATIFILRQNYSEQKFVSELLQMQQSNRIKNPYLLMNDYKELSTKYGYYGTYRYKYGYSNSYSNNYDGSIEESKVKKKNFFLGLINRFK